jgi:hypothetical protein
LTRGEHEWPEIWAILAWFITVWLSGSITFFLFSQRRIAARDEAISASARKGCVYVVAFVLAVLGVGWLITKIFG